MAKPEKQEDVKYDPRAMPLARVEQRTVRDPLDTELMVEISHQLGRLRRRIDDTNEALKDYAKAQRGEIADDDAERDRLARIGELVMQIIRLKQAFTYLGMGPHGARTAAIGGVEATSHLNTPTESLLDALEALRAKTEGK